MGEAYMRGLAAREMHEELLGHAVVFQRHASELFALVGPSNPGTEGSPIGVDILARQMEFLQMQKEILEMQSSEDEIYIKMTNIIDENP